MMEIVEKLETLKKQSKLPAKVAAILKDLYLSYSNSVVSHSDYSKQDIVDIFSAVIPLIVEQAAHPHQFGSFHQAITSPINYYQVGIDFVKPLISKVVVRGEANVETIAKMIDQNENVILLANHQTELDPQAISIALEDKFPKLAKEIIFVAGDRVVTDPIAVPFSLGRNLLCIYSKRHIAHPPEKKMEKQMHNQRTMRVMKELLSMGGKFIYVAPSGGRDRMNSSGTIPLAEFEPNNIEMFRLMAEQAGHITHFFPLALVTHDLLPPPRDVESELGEMRTANRTHALFSFGSEIDTKNFAKSHVADRIERRKALADHVFQLVNEAYQKLLKE
jgi:glycerol-3-phosphate O-acyltransferase